MSEWVMERPLSKLTIKDLKPLIREIVREEQAQLIQPLYTSGRRDWQRQRVREEYILTLVREGYTSDAIQQLVERFDTSDLQWATDAESARARLHAYGQAKFREWCRTRGIEYDALTDEQVTDLINQVLLEAKEQA